MLGTELASGCSLSWVRWNKCPLPVFRVWVTVLLLYCVWRLGFSLTPFTALKDGYRKVEQDLPAFEDLEGAARALMRLQDVYLLNVKGLAQGVFQRVTGSSITDLYSPRQLFSLTADDCFHVGKVTCKEDQLLRSTSLRMSCVSAVFVYSLCCGKPSIFDTAPFFRRGKQGSDRVDH